jgi:hypothetical protein
MEKMNYSKVELAMQCRYKLFQILWIIDEAKKEDLAKKTIEAKRLYEKIDVFLEYSLKHQVEKQLKSIFSTSERLNCLLGELIEDLSKNRNSRNKIRELLLLFVLKSSVSIVSFFLYLILAILLELLPNYYSEERQTIFKLSNLLLSEDAQSVLEVLITRESESNRSLLRQKILMFYLFFDILWGNRIVPYFQNKFLPNTKEVD